MTSGGDRSHPTNEEIRALLSELPRPAPPPGFTEAVMERIRRERRRRIPRILWLAAAAAFAIPASTLLLAPGGPTTVPGPAADVAARGAASLPESPERAEFEAIRADYRRLAEEMELLRQFAGESPGRAAPGPMVRIGGSDQLDVFLDLRAFIESAPRSALPESAVIPASEGPSGRR